MQELREAVPRLRILFLTASPGLDTGTKSASDRRQWAEAALGAPPVLLAYTVEERAAMRTAVNPRPPVPSAWKEVDLGTPQLDDTSANMVTELVVGRALEPDVRDWTAIDNLANTTLVKQLLDAGALLEHVGAPQPMRRAEHGALGEATQCHQSVLVFHKNAAAADRHLEAMRDETRATVHDLRAAAEEAPAARQAARAAFEGAFLAQTGGPAIAFVDATQQRGIDHFGRNVTAVVLVGDFDAREKTQIAARLGRPGRLAPGELVPEAYTLVEITSAWAKAVGDATVRRCSTRALKLSPAADTVFKRLAKKMEEEERDEEEIEKVEAAAKRLTKVDLGKDLAKMYLEAALRDARPSDAYYEACRTFHAWEAVGEEEEEEEVEEEEA